MAPQSGSIGLRRGVRRLTPGRRGDRAPRSPREGRTRAVRKVEPIEVSQVEDAIDLNGAIAAALRDLAAVQPSKGQSNGYQRAARAFFTLDQSIVDLIPPDGQPPAIPNVGPSSWRVVAEVIATGGSAIVAAAIDAAPGGALTVSRLHDARQGFLSRAAALAVLGDAGLASVTRGAYRGDLQMHSPWSDGRQSIADLAAGCQARGYDYCAVTDHSHGLPIAGGVSWTDLRAQHREIDAINTTLEGHFVVLKGIEANILADGSVDVPAERMGDFDLVLAAPHARLRVDTDQTARLVAAVRTPGVHVLAHPRGRKIDERIGIRADWPRVFAAAAAANVAVEIDGDPSRQDLDAPLAAQALAAGCLLAVDSDAHAVEELDYVDVGLAHARLAGAPAARVINTWTADALQKWARERR